MNESFFWVFDELVDLFLKTSLNDLFIDSVIQLRKLTGGEH